MVSSPNSARCANGILPLKEKGYKEIPTVERYSIQSPCMVIKHVDYMKSIKMDGVLYIGPTNGSEDSVGGRAL